MQLLAAQVEEAVAEPRLLGIVVVAEDRHRQLSAAADSTSIRAAKTSTSPVGRFGIDRLGRARLHLAVDADHPFGPHLLGRREGRRFGVGDDLGQAVVVAQIDEQQPAMVADAVHPAGEADGLADVVGAERAAGVASVAVHGGNPRCLAAETGLFGARKSARAPALVKAALIARNAVKDRVEPSRSRVGEIDPVRMAETAPGRYRPVRSASSGSARGTP